jgi:hypothetical protein
VCERERERERERDTFRKHLLSLVFKHLKTYFTLLAGKARGIQVSAVSMNSNAEMFKQKNSRCFP